MAERKSFCFILPKFAPENIGGAELQVMYLAEELVSRGFVVNYIREKSSNTLVAETYNGIRLWQIPHIRHFFLQWLNIGALTKVIRETRADVIYCRVSKSYLAAAVKVASEIDGKAAWACSHDRETELFQTRTSGLLKKIFEHFEQTLFSKMLHRANVRFVQSDYQKQQLLENFQLDAVMLENAHPLPKWREDTVRKQQVIWVANFRDFKRPEIFIQLAEHLRELEMDFIMVGHIANAEMLKTVEAAMLQNNNFKYVGPLSVNNVEELFWNSRLFVNTSSQEGFPNTFIQALMRGVPIISMNVDPAAIISNNNLGSMEPEFEKFAEEVKRFMSDDELWQRTSQKCRSFAGQRFSINSYTDRFLEALEIENS